MLPSQLDQAFDETGLELEDLFEAEDDDGMSEVEDEDEDEEGMTWEDVEKAAQIAIDTARDFMAANILPDIEKAERYFRGELDGPEPDENRSKVVATKVRDVIHMAKPGIARVFFSSDRPVEFRADGSDQWSVISAEQATRYAHQTFRRQRGFLLLSGAIHNACVQKVGITKTYREQTTETKVYRLFGMTEQQIAVLANDPEVTFVRGPTQADVVAGIPLFDATVARAEKRGRDRMDIVPIQEFFVNAAATSETDNTVIGHRTAKAIGDIKAMGLNIDEDVLEELDGPTDDLELDDPDASGVGTARRGYVAQGVSSPLGAEDPMRKVWLTEAYMRFDMRGDGNPMLYRLLCGGTMNRLLDIEPVADNPFAVYHLFPIPGTFFGYSLADLVMAEQDAGSSLWRDILDNAKMVNTPRTAVVDDQVNMDDVLNNEIGAVVRMRAPGMIQPLEVPFVAGQTLAAMQYLDGTIEEKTGITKASAGLDPDALQSTTRAAVNATVQAAAGQVEQMARNLAETGMVRQFTLLLRNIIQYSDGPVTLDDGATMHQFDPRVWKTDMEMEVNVGTGTGKEDVKIAALDSVIQFQLGIWQTYGPDNGMVTMEGIYNAQADKMVLAGLRNPARYLKPITPTYEAQLKALAEQKKAQEAQQQGQMGDPSAALAQAEIQKAGMKAQTDMQKLALQAQKAQMDDDFRRDQMLQNLAVEAAKIDAKIGVDIAGIIAAQRAPQNPTSAPAPAPAPAAQQPQQQPGGLM